MVPGNQIEIVATFASHGPSFTPNARNIADFAGGYSFASESCACRIGMRRRELHERPAARARPPCCLAATAPPMSGSFGRPPAPRRRSGRSCWQSSLPGGMGWVIPFVKQYPDHRNADGRVA